MSRPSRIVRPGFERAALLEQQIGDRSVERAGIDVHETQPLGKTFGRRALPGTRGTIDRDDGARFRHGTNQLAQHFGRSGIAHFRTRVLPVERATDRPPARDFFFSDDFDFSVDFRFLK